MDNKLIKNLGEAVEDIAKNGTNGEDKEGDPSENDDQISIDSNDEDLGKVKNKYVSLPFFIASITSRC